MCPGSGCLKAAGTGTLAFEGLGPCEVVGMVSCGGCPGKRAVLRAGVLKDRGAEVIAFASCISKGTPIGFPCPNIEAMKQAVRKKVGGEIIVLDYTH